MSEAKKVPVFHVGQCVRIKTVKDMKAEGWRVDARGGIAIPGYFAPEMYDYQDSVEKIKSISPGREYSTVLFHTKLRAYPWTFTTHMIAPLGGKYPSNYGGPGAPI